MMRGISIVSTCPVLEHGLTHVIPIALPIRLWRIGWRHRMTLTIEDSSPEQGDASIGSASAGAASTTA